MEYSSEYIKSSINDVTDYHLLINDSCCYYDPHKYCFIVIIIVVGVTLFLLNVKAIWSNKIANSKYPVENMSNNSNVDTMNTSLNFQREVSINPFLAQEGTWRH
jgi:hypothetical protein